MAITDFAFFETEAGQTQALSSSNPILGNASLQLSRGAATGSNLSCNNVRALGPTSHGYTRGRLRTSVRLDVHDTTTNHALGLYCMANAFDLTKGSGNCYALALRTSATTGTIDSLRLLKFTAGIVAPTSPLVTYATGSIALGTIVSIEFEWRLDTRLNQIRLIGRFSATHAFPSLPTLPTVIDQIETSSILTTSVGEGLFIYINGTGGHTSTFAETSFFGMT